MNWEYYVGIGIGIIVVVVSLVRGIGGRKAPLSRLDPTGPLPVSDIERYYDARGPVLVWERVRGWKLNHVPTTLMDHPTTDYLVLTPRLLEFCTGMSGRMELDFNFLVGAIESVDFEPNALTGGAAGDGLMTVHTPSGQTKLVTSAAAAQAVERAVAEAHGVPPESAGNVSAAR